MAVAGAYWALGIVSFPGSAWERWTQEAEPPPSGKIPRTRRTLARVAIPCRCGEREVLRG